MTPTLACIKSARTLNEAKFGRHGSTNPAFHASSMARVSGSLFPSDGRFCFSSNSQFRENPEPLSRDFNDRSQRKLWVGKAPVELTVLAAHADRIAKTKRRLLRHGAYPLTSSRRRRFVHLAVMLSMSPESWIKTDPSECSRSIGIGVQIETEYAVRQGRFPRRYKCLLMSML